MGCQSSSKAAGGNSTSISAILGFTLCVSALPLAFTTSHCRSHLNPAVRPSEPSDQSSTRYRTAGHEKNDWFQ